MNDKPYITVSGQRSPRWAVWKRIKLVTSEGTVYLDRLRLLQTPYFGIYLHWIEGPDPDPDPHDHPWDFMSLVLRGGYDELFHPFPSVHLEMHKRVRRWSRWSWHRMDRYSAHRIIAVLPRTLTLVIVGPRSRNWGFWTAEGLVYWQEYEARPDSKQVHY